MAGSRHIDAVFVSKAALEDGAVARARVITDDKRAARRAGPSPRPAAATRQWRHSAAASTFFCAHSDDSSEGQIANRFEGLASDDDDSTPDLVSASSSSSAWETASEGAGSLVDGSGSSSDDSEAESPADVGYSADVRPFPARSRAPSDDSDRTTFGARRRSWSSMEGSEVSDASAASEASDASAASEASEASDGDDSDASHGGPSRQFYEETQALVCFEFAEEMASSGPFAVDDVAFARCFYDSVTTVVEANRGNWAWVDYSWFACTPFLACVGSPSGRPSTSPSGRGACGSRGSRSSRRPPPAPLPWILTSLAAAAALPTWASEGGGNLGLAPALRPGLYDGVAYHGLYALQCLAPFAFLVDWERCLRFRGALEARGLGHVADAFAAEGIVDAATAAPEDGEFARFDSFAGRRALGPLRRSARRSARRASRAPPPPPRRATRRDLLCPITHELFRDPVFLADGHVYERSAIERWFAAGKRVSPLTNAPVSEALAPAHAVSAMVAAHAGAASAAAGRTAAPANPFSGRSVGEHLANRVAGDAPPPA
ncbi:hypothetical protein JL721_11791 [Aureococcus anophagefferens]|nr:hypothetical protein JL721_11791 [Aureococcus anophagefferens]